MAARQIQATQTLEEFRQQFNALSATDFGDIANLSGQIASTNIVDAMNETISIATSTAGWTIEDSSSTQQIIGGGNILKVFGTSNEIEAVVSATDTLTIGLPDAVSITTSLTAPTLNGGSIQITGNTITSTDSTSISLGSDGLTTSGTISGNSFSSAGTSHTLGTIQISGNTISSTDSSEIDFDDTVKATSFFTDSGLGRFFEQNGYPRIESTQTGGSGTFGDNVLIMDANMFMNQNHAIIFEGSTTDNNTTTLTVADPTGNNTLTLPDETGTIISTASIDAVTESMMANDSIGQNELKSVVTLQILNSSGTVVKTLYGAGA